jgi:hypothetical protein
MDKKYIIRHKILTFLFSKIEYDEVDAPKLSKTKTDLKEVAAVIGFTYAEVLNAHHGIPDSEAICVCGDKHYMMLQRDGLDAVIEKRWMVAGRKKLYDGIYDLIKWIAPVCLLIITIFTTVRNVKLLNDNSNNKEEIEKLRIQLKAIEKSQNK